MTLSEIRDVLEAETLVDQSPDVQVHGASASDLLSDVLAFTKGNALLLTGLANTQVVRTAEMVDVAVICFVRGKRPDSETIELARDKNIQVLCTKLSMYDACGRLHSRGLLDCNES